MLACLFFSVRRTIGTRIRERCVGVRHAKDTRGEWYLLAPQSVRVARAIPPFLMPANEELRTARRSGARRLLFADDRMTREVEPLIFRQRPLSRSEARSCSAR